MELWKCKLLPTKLAENLIKHSTCLMKTGKSDNYWLIKVNRCVLTVHFILSEHVNAFARTNIHKEHGSLFSGEVIKVNPINLSNSKTQSGKGMHRETEHNHDAVKIEIQPAVSDPPLSCPPSEQGCSVGYLRQRCPRHCPLQGGDPHCLP